MNVQGIHHITAISSSAQETYDFYTKILGLRLVKKSVNQDDVEIYHLFFGNKVGSPGMDLTFFPFAGVLRGLRGNGLVTTISFAVPVGSLSFWKDRFETLKIKHESITKEFGQSRVIFYDSDDQKLELVEVSEIDEEYKNNVWTKEIAKEQAIHSFHSATLNVLNIDSILPVLDVFGYKEITKEEERYLFQLPGKLSAGQLVVEEKPSTELSINGYGTVHHIAFQVKDDKEQLVLRQKLVDIDEQPTHVIDRYYFKSVYFRTKAGILFELATHGPGFTADEDEKVLGEKLALPPFLEPHRKEIESLIKPINTIS